MDLEKSSLVPNIGIPPIDASAPTKTETATFAIGCFWGPDSRFGIVAGIVRTRVGYSGGTKKYPAYHSLDDHTEAIQIDYDPTQISYEELLDIFWHSHNPTERPWSRQYMSMVFYHNEEQKRLAVKTRARQRTRIKGKVFTEIIPTSEFCLAEAYHQKYWLRRVPDLVEEFNAMYPDPDDFIASTAVARVNGYLGGYGTFAALQIELNGFGLSMEGNKKLLDIVYALEH